MKTSIYIPRTMKIIQVITLITGLQINFLFALNPFESGRLHHLSKRDTCSNGIIAVQNEELFNELSLLAPATPAEATFFDEPANAGIKPTQAATDKIMFDEKTILDGYALLAPVTPLTATFDDGN